MTLLRLKQYIRTTLNKFILNNYILYMAFSFRVISSATTAWKSHHSETIKNEAAFCQRQSDSEIGLRFFPGYFLLVPGTQAGSRWLNRKLSVYTSTSLKIKKTTNFSTCEMKLRFQFDVVSRHERKTCRWCRCARCWNTVDRSGLSQERWTYE